MTAVRCGRVWATLKRIQARYPLIQIVALIAVFTYGALTLPGLASWISIRSILVLAALVGLASGGQTLLILMGGFDLGVAGFIVAGALTVTALSAKYHITVRRGARVCALAGSAVLGGLAGYICHRFRINPLVVTLAMGTIALGHRRVAEWRERGVRQCARVVDDAGRARSQDVRDRPPTVGRDLDSGADPVCGLPVPHQGRAQPVRDRGKSARRRLRADQHAPGLDRRVCVQRRHRGARRCPDRRLRRHRRRRRSGTRTCSRAWSP